MATSGVVSYADYIVHIGPATGDQRYSIQVIGPESISASGEFHQPFREDEIQAFYIVDESLARGSFDLVAVGQRLTEALFTPAVAAVLRPALDHPTLRLRLRLWIEPPELDVIPWELLCHPATGQFIGTSPQVALSRYFGLSRATPAPLLAGPLAMLLVSASPAEFPPLDLAMSCARIKSALAGLGEQIEIHTLAPARFESLHQALLEHNYQLLHFIGHGWLNPATRSGEVLFEDETGQAEVIKAEDFGLLVANRGIRLVYLDACKTGQAWPAPPGSQALSGLGVAAAVVQAGVPAVVAMRFKIADAIAQQCASRFYSSLVSGWPVDTALAEGRLAIKSQSADWAAPTLFMRSPDGQLFRREPAVAASRQPAASEWAILKQRLAQERLDALVEEYTAVHNQLLATVEADTRVRLARKLKLLETELNQALPAS